MLELHIWGPVFGLPSIDAECIAAIAYLHNAIQDDSTWRIIPSNDTTVSPSGSLPALNHDGVWVSGYLAIVSHLVDKSLARDLDAALNPSQRADAAAFAALLAVRASALLDLSLCVSAANWSATTRPAYSSLLRFPFTWTVPPMIRAHAIRRVEHLGLADLDTDFDPHSGLHLSGVGGGAGALPETLRKHLPTTSISNSRRTVLEEMTPEEAAAIRLVGLAEDCLGVLERALVSDADKMPRFFLGEQQQQLTSLDCLALGYAALMLRAPVPRAFLRDWMVEHAPRLTAFVDRRLPTVMPAHDSRVWAAATPPSPPRSSALATAGRVADSIIRHLPVLGEYYADEMRQRYEQKGTLGSRLVALAAGWILAGAACGCLAHWYRGLLPFGAPSQQWFVYRPSASRFGNLGVMLNSVLGPAAAR